MEKLRTIVLLGCFFCGFSVVAQDYFFGKVSIEDGLSQSTINAITQDARGFLWLGTQDGLNRYDGQHFKVFKRNPFDTTSLGDNFITALLFDSQERLWIGTRNAGLHLFDPLTERFQRFSFDENNSASVSANHIVTLYEDNLGELWVGTSNGFNRVLCPEKNNSKVNFERYQFIEDLKIRRTPGKYFIRSILHDPKGYLLVGTFNGIWRYKRTATGQLVPAEDERPFMSYPFTFNTLGLDAAGDIWAGTNRGLLKLSNTPENINERASYQIYLSDQEIMDIQLMRNENMLIATENGLLLNSCDEGTYLNDFLSIQDQQEGGSTQSRQLNRVFEDQLYDGLLWLGTRLAGLIKMQEKRNKFHTLHLDPGTSLAAQLSPSVRFVFEDSVGWIWIALKEAILLYEPEKEQFQKVLREIPLLNSKRSIRTSLISSIYQDDQGQVWAVTYLGVFKLSKNKKGVLEAAYFPQQEDCEDRSVFALHEAKEGYYLGTHLGVSFLDRATGKIKDCPIVVDTLGARNSNYRVHAFLKDRQNNLWIGSTNGLILFRDVQTPIWKSLQQKPEIFYHNKNDLNSLVDDYIHQILEDRFGNIWLGTRLGLVKVQVREQEVTFTTFREEDGLANNVVYNIIEDTLHARLWLSTNNGLSRFDPQGLHFDNFRTRDGLQGNEFNEFAMHQGASGRFYFGGVDGLTYFNPEEIQLEDPHNPVWITELSVGEGEVINLLEADRNLPIELDYAQNSFSIKFVGLNYISPGSQDYVYDLEGGNIKSSVIGKSNQINFPRLEPGQYKLSIRTLGGQSTIDQGSDHITIIICSPFWRKTWFYVLLGFACVLVIGGLYHLQYQMKMNRVAEIEKVRISAAQDFHDELGSKLSIISMYSELTREKLNNKDQKTAVLLDKVIRTSNSLYDSMKDMIWVLNPEQDKLQDLFFQLKDFGEELFSQAQIDFQCHGIAAEMDHIELSVHSKRHILLIFKEAMHNALKHAQCKTIKLTVQREKEHLKFSLEDNGRGFQNSTKNTGEGLRNMQYRANKIKSALRITTNHAGTKIELLCPFT